MEAEPPAVKMNDMLGGILTYKLKACRRPCLAGAILRQDVEGEPRLRSCSAVKATVVSQLRSAACSRSVLFRGRPLPALLLKSI